MFDLPEKLKGLYFMQSKANARLSRWAWAGEELQSTGRRRIEKFHFFPGPAMQTTISTGKLRAPLQNQSSVFQTQKWIYFLMYAQQTYHWVTVINSVNPVKRRCFTCWETQKLINSYSANFRLSKLSTQQTFDSAYFRLSKLLTP